MTELSGAPTCADCGAPMRQTYAILTMKGGCQRLPTGMVCSSEDCEEERRIRERAARRAAEDELIRQAQESGLLAPDDATEEEKYL